MKLKTILSALLLVVAQGVWAGATWIGDSYIKVNDTWYNASGTGDWATGGVFNGHNFGNITSSTLTIGAQIQVHADEDANWGSGVLDMFYKFDDDGSGTGWTKHTLSYSAYGNQYGNNMMYQSGGSNFTTDDIDISGLANGQHTLSIFFGPLDGHYDSNNNQNYVATFTKGIFAINTDITGSGTVTVKAGEDVVTSAEVGTSLSVILDASEGYTIYGADIDGVSIYYDTFDRQSDDYWVGTITMPESDITIKPIFVKPYSAIMARSVYGKFDISFSPTLTPTSDYVEIGAEVTLTVTPCAGYEIESVIAYKYDSGRYTDLALTDNGDGTYTFIMPEEEVMVNVDYYKEGGDNAINVGTVEGGILRFYNSDGDPIKAANEGDVVTVQASRTSASLERDFVTFITVTDADGQPVEVRTIQGGGMYGADSDGFTMPAKAVTVSAAFKNKISLPSASLLGTSGTCEVFVGGESRNYADENELVTCVATPGDGYVLAGLRVGYMNYETSEPVYVSCTKVDDNTYTFYMPDRSVSVSPLFVEDFSDSWLADGVRASSFASQDDNQKTITISSAAQLGLLAYNVNFGGETYEGYTISIVADHIDLSDRDWLPIGGVSSGRTAVPVVSPVGGGGYPSASGFLGTFDGAAKPIQNMNVTGSTNVGLFSDVQSGAIVKNVFLTDPEVKGEMYVGAIAGACSGGTIMNCHVSYGNVEVPTSAQDVAAIGGIAGMCTDGVIEGSTVMGTNIYPVISSAQGIGGVVGGIIFERSGSTVKNNLFAGNIFMVSGNYLVGAIAGIDQNYSYYNEYNTITNNYYINGGSPLQSVTPNTTLKGVDGEDIDGGAIRAYAYDAKPLDFGDVVTDYGYGMEAYSAGLHYSPMWYSPIQPTTMDITLDDSGNNSTLLATYEGVEGKVTLGGRTFYKDGSWNTICLPFGINDINDSPLRSENETVELWQISTTENSGYDEDSHELTLNFENCKDPDDETDPDNVVIGVTTLAAGRPYLIRWTNASGTLNNPVFTNVTITATSPEDDNTFGNNNEITFIGTFAKRTFETEDRSILFLGGGNTLYWPQPSGENIPSIGACRAYFQLNGITAGDPDDTQNPVRSFKLNFGDETSSIVNGEWRTDNRANVWYSLDGRKLDGKPMKAGLYIVNGKKVNIK